MATIRKLRNRWQAVVRRKRIHVSKTFWNKSDARKWSYRVEALIETGLYFGGVETEKQKNYCNILVI